MKTIWMCEDLGDMTQSGFDMTARGAERLVADNRGYISPAQCRKDGWMKSAVKIEVPDAAAAILISHLR